MYAANYNGIFGPVCDSTGVPWHLWGKEEADVVCRFFNIFFRLATRPCAALWLGGGHRWDRGAFLHIGLYSLSLNALGAQLGLDVTAKIRFGRFGIFFQTNLLWLKDVTSLTQAPTDLA